MKTIRRNYHNITFQKEGCGDLAALSDGNQILSTWMPDERERQIIADGGAICLIIAGNAQPPVAVMTEQEAMQLGMHEPINDTRH